MLTYVTAFLDIGRNDWKQFERNVDTYFEHFAPLAEMFKGMNKAEYGMVIFIDAKHSERLRKMTDPATQLIEITQESLSKISVLWGRLDREREIMESQQYRLLMASRLRFPEHHNPKYTLINHAKIDLVVEAGKYTTSKYFCWVDFGYFQKSDRIPAKPIDISKLNPNTVNYTLINPLDSRDENLMYTLMNAPERIGGFFFFGHREVLRKYQELFHNVHETFQSANLADDDQHIALRCYYENPELFTLHLLGGWHKALIAFQKTD